MASARQCRRLAGAPHCTDGSYLSCTDYLDNCPLPIPSGLALEHEGTSRKAGGGSGKESGRGCQGYVQGRVHGENIESKGDALLRACLSQSESKFTASLLNSEQGEILSLKVKRAIPEQHPDLHLLSVMSDASRGVACNRVRKRIPFTVFAFWCVFPLSWVHNHTS
eukprot:scaffold100788_cov32-Tisochrysis_lutea.AAC.1